MAEYQDDKWLWLIHVCRFRWVYCQYDSLRRCLPGHIGHALEELPETLDKTYERTLRGIDNENWEFANRLFQCIAVAARPLRVKELAEFLAFHFNTGPIPRFYEDWRLPDPVDTVLSTCSSFIAIVNVGGSNIVQFSHFSVKEYLTSPRLAESSDAILHRYHVSFTHAHAHTLVAQACLSILLHLDDSVTRDSLKHFPLVGYAAEHWLDHARFENVSQNVEDGMKQLFDPKKPHFAIWVWIHEPGVPYGMQTECAEKPLPLTGTPLHYAALCGLHTIVQFLAIEHSQDVNSQGFHDNSTPLHLASSGGHVEAARILLEHGADPTAHDDNGATPLHLASSGGHVEAAQILLEHGADPTAQDKNGATPLHLASSRGQVEVAQILLERSADLTAQDKNGASPLHLASSGGHVEAAQILLERGADPTAQDKNGASPLHLASSGGQVEVAQILLEHGADPTARDKNGTTPLHLASSGGYVKAARILIEYGADSTACDNNGTTPLYLASSGGHEAVAHVLL